jgi:uncharacterized membrane protein YedE/YeeE
MADIITVLILGISIGMVFGFILQRGRFCMNSAFRDIILLKEYKLMKGVLLAIAVSMIGFSIFILGGILAANPKPFTVLGSIIGGFIFGIGMVLASGCASGTTYRVGEGMIGSLVALVGLGLGAYLTKFSILSIVSGSLITPMADPVTGGGLRIAGDATPIVMFIIGIIIIGIFSYTNLLPYLKERKEKNEPILDFTDMKTKIFNTSYPWWVSGIAIGILNCVAWISSAAAGRNYPMGITAGWLGWLSFLLTWNITAFNWLVFMVVGVILGAFIAAIISKEFKIRIPKEPKTLLIQLLGGFLMGFGAVTAAGCNIGNFLSGIPMGSVGSLVVGIFIIIGCWAMTYIMFMRD